MKKLIKIFVSIAEGFGRARAATHFTRMGRPDLARQIMARD